MRVNLRSEQRRPASGTYSISWQGEDSLTRSAEVTGVDCSRAGLGFRCAVGLRPALTVFVQGLSGVAGYATVRHCTPLESGYAIGVQLHEPETDSAPASDHTIDYYEFLQISPRAEFATIQRIYRFLATRYHPDNPTTGDAEKFLLVKQAFEVLSDASRRAAYDAGRQQSEPDVNPALESVDYMDGVEGEINRRMAVLSLLYGKRRTCPDDPKISLAELEKHMNFPREYLDFATWYLRSKKFITKEDNSDFTLTALGVDYVEANASKIPILHKMLYQGRPPAQESASRKPAHHEPYRLGPASGAPDAAADSSV